MFRTLAPVYHQHQLLVHEKGCINKIYTKTEAYCIKWRNQNIQMNHLKYIIIESQSPINQFILIFFLF